MKKVLFWSSIFLVIAAVVFVSYQAYRQLNGYGHSYIVVEGPFHQEFSGDLYPEKPDRIKEWLLTQVPIGTHKKEVLEILQKSFSVDLTSGKVRIDEKGGHFAGSQWTEIEIHFDSENRLKNIYIKQHWAWL